MNSLRICKLRAGYGRLPERSRLKEMKNGAGELSMRLTKAEQKVLKVLTMMQGRGILIPDEQAEKDTALQNLCRKKLAVKISEREGFRRYRHTGKGRSQPAVST